MFQCYDGDVKKHPHLAKGVGAVGKINYFSSADVNQRRGLGFRSATSA